MRGFLLTGKNGQLGWEVARRARAAGLCGTSLSRAELDITDRMSVRNAVARLGPSIIINAAAYTAVDKAEAEPEAAFAVNRDGAANLAAVCAEEGLPLIHISTDYVFDGSKLGPYVEQDPVSPLNQYGQSKLAGEEAVRQLCPKHIILRTAWVYGVHGQNFVKNMLHLARVRNRLKVVDDQRGSPTFAGDLADAVIVLAKRIDSAEPGHETYGTFHCAGLGATTWCEFAHEIFRIAAPTLERLPEVEAISTDDHPTGARRPRNSVLDCSRLATAHGISLRPWRAALADMVKAAMAEVRVK